MPSLTISPVFARAIGVGLLAASMTGCGTSDSTPPAPVAGGLSTLISTTSPTPLPSTATAAPTVVTTDVPATKSLAAQFISSASFGPTAKATDAVMAQGYTGWIADQINKPSQSHRAYFDEYLMLLPQGTAVVQDPLYRSFWKQAITGEDELRQRVAFALSQIFVVSVVDLPGAHQIRGVMDYYDMLGRNAFGNFRKLLEDVSLHPTMGQYLTYLRNQKEDPARGRVPDENYAREVMQLFTIGLYQLNVDGTVKLDSRNEPIETYSNDDVSGLAKVFTGFSWAGPDKTDARFFRASDVGGHAPNFDITPMQGYPRFHSTSEKRFLGVTIPVQNPAAPETSLRIALDTLFNHPNVGPFIGKQLIQRLVTSNPSPAYVARVSAAFNNNGQGVRGDMRAVIYAILTDPEARTTARLANPTWGKVREPILRLAAFLRATNAKSSSGLFLIGGTDSPADSLGQTAFRSPSVFNFFRPGYIPPNSALANAGLTAPELQIVHETSVAGYLNFMRSVVQNGIGSGNPRDVQPDYTPFIAVANDAALLTNRIDEALTSGLMSEATRVQIRDAIASVAIPTNSTSAADTARRNRVMLGFFLALASPEFLVQR